MSQRGSFVTEYIYCQNCLKAVQAVLISDKKELKGVQIPHWEGEGYLPIIAGKVGGSYSSEEIIEFEYNYIPKIKEKICCDVRICVFAELETKIFTIEPI